MKRILTFLREFFRRPSEQELIANGIVPTGRRYDRELVEAMQRKAMDRGGCQVTVSLQFLDANLEELRSMKDRLDGMCCFFLGEDDEAEHCLAVASDWVEQAIHALSDLRATATKPTTPIP